MSNATFNEGGLELILIEVVAGVGRTHAASAVGAAAAAAAASLVGLVEQLFVTLGYRGSRSPRLSNTQTVYLPHTPHHTPVGLKMDEPIERQWVRKVVPRPIGFSIGQ